jgi:hypothetical protein
VFVKSNVKIDDNRTHESFRELHLIIGRIGKKDNKGVQSELTSSLLW